MKFIETRIEDLIILEPTVFGDNRGYFLESYNQDKFKEIIGEDVELEKVETNDNRSYHVSSKKIKDILSFEAKFTIQDAIKDLKDAFEQKKLINTLNSSKYFNIKKMQEINLK